MMLPHDQKDPRERLVNDLWWKACMGYKEQHVDPDVVLEFAVLVAKHCHQLNKEVISDLKSDPNADIPKEVLDSIKTKLRTKLYAEFEIE